jgi:hypothetical protein
MPFERNTPFDDASWFAGTSSINVSQTSGDVNNIYPPSGSSSSSRKLAFFEAFSTTTGAATGTDIDLWNDTAAREAVHASDIMVREKEEASLPFSQEQLAYRESYIKLLTLYNKAGEQYSRLVSVWGGSLDMVMRDTVLLDVDKESIFTQALELHDLGVEVYRHATGRELPSVYKSRSETLHACIPGLELMPGNDSWSAARTPATPLGGIRIGHHSWHPLTAIDKWSKLEQTVVIDVVD